VTEEDVLILVADDNADERFITSAMLSYGGYQVRECARASEAVTLARRLHPTCIVLDLQFLGEMRGIEAIEQLKADPLTQNIPILVHSSFLADMRPRLRDLNVQTLGKPATPAEMLDAVRKLIGPPGKP
jgi:CheY-like chemotaxis protein